MPQEKMGRRWSHTLLLALNTISLLVNTIVANKPELAIVVTVFCLISKFICTATFVIVYVQCIELFPTCIRNSGMGLTILACTIIGNEQTPFSQKKNPQKLCKLF